MIFIFLIVFVCCCECGCMCPTSHMWRLKVNFVKFVLFFCFGPFSGETVSRLPGLHCKHLYLLRHLKGPIKKLKTTKSCYYMSVTKEW